MNDDVDALFERRSELEATDTQLARISQLISQEAEIEGEIDTLEQALSEAKERSKNIRHNELPEAMLSARMREFTTENGLKAKIVFVTDGALGSAKTPEEIAEKEAKLDLIIENGGGEIVKQMVTIAFPKEMVDAAEAFREWCAKEFAKRAKAKKGAGWGQVTVNRERSVHHQTLSKWIREKMEDDDVTQHLTSSFFERVGIWYGEAAKLIFPKRSDNAQS